MLFRLLRDLRALDLGRRKRALIAISFVFFSCFVCRCWRRRGDKGVVYYFNYVDDYKKCDGIENNTMCGATLHVQSCGGFDSLIDQYLGAHPYEDLHQPRRLFFLFFFFFFFLSRISIAVAPLPWSIS